MRAQNSLPSIWDKNLKFTAKSKDIVFSPRGNFLVQEDGSPGYWLILHIIVYLFLTKKDGAAI